MNESQSNHAAGATEAAKGHNVEILISWLLRIGVVLSLAIVLTGLVLSFIHHRDYVGSHEALARVTSSTRLFPSSISATLVGVSQLRGEAVIMLGLILLIATPVMRVAVSIFAFVYERDRVFILITSLVLALLILSFYLGKVEA